MSLKSLIKPVCRDSGTGRSNTPVCHLHRQASILVEQGIPHYAATIGEVDEYLSAIRTGR